MGFWYNWFGRRAAQSGEAAEGEEEEGVTPSRHARAWRGHPRRSSVLPAASNKQDVDGRDKRGHDRQIKRCALGWRTTYRNFLGTARSAPLPTLRLL